MPTQNVRQIDDARWKTGRANLAGTQSWPDEVTLYYIDCPPPSGTETKATILLIHGFPETSYQFRRVITPLSDAGYRVIAPDYRGHGHSSHPRNGYDKLTMATDLHQLVTERFQITTPIHVVGHDIGGMVAHAYAVKFPKDTLSLTWGECPLPGTAEYEKFKYEAGEWHFTFHWQTDIPEALVQGRERIYLKHFYDRLGNKPDAINKHDVDYYASMYAQPGGMRCGFDTYRAFHQDADDNAKILKEQGKCKVPAQSLNGDTSFLAVIAEKMMREMYENWRCATVEGSGHWCAEENPEDFVKKVLAFVGEIKG